MSEKELSDSEYIQSLMEDFDLSSEDSIGELLEAIADEEAEDGESGDSEE